MSKPQVVLGLLFLFLSSNLKFVFCPDPQSNEGVKEKTESNPVQAAGNLPQPVQLRKKTEESRKSSSSSGSEKSPTQASRGSSGSLKLSEEEKEIYGTFVGRKPKSGSRTGSAGSGSQSPTRSKSSSSQQDVDESLYEQYDIPQPGSTKKETKAQANIKPHAQLSRANVPRVGSPPILSSIQTAEDLYDTIGPVQEELKTIRNKPPAPNPVELESGLLRKSELERPASGIYAEVRKFEDQPIYPPKKLSSNTLKRTESDENDLVLVDSNLYGISNPRPASISRSSRPNPISEEELAAAGYEAPEDFRRVEYISAGSGTKSELTRFKRSSSEGELSGLYNIREVSKQLNAYVDGFDRLLRQLKELSENVRTLAKSP